MKQIEAAFRAAKIEMHSSEDLRAVRWRKLMWNIPYNGLSVSARRRHAPNYGASANKPFGRRTHAGSSRGSRRLRKSDRKRHVDKMLADTRKMVPYASSMLLDYRHGRAMEVEAIVGNPLRASIAAGGIDLRRLKCSTGN